MKKLFSKRSKTPTVGATYSGGDYGPPGQSGRPSLPDAQPSSDSASLIRPQPTYASPEPAHVSPPASYNPLQQQQQPAVAPYPTPDSGYGRTMSPATVTSYTTQQQQRAMSPASPSAGAGSNAHGLGLNGGSYAGSQAIPQQENTTHVTEVMSENEGKLSVGSVADLRASASASEWRRLPLAPWLARSADPLVRARRIDFGSVSAAKWTGCDRS